MVKRQTHHITHDKGEYARILILRTIGNFLIFSSLFMLARTFYGPVREEARYFIGSNLHKQYVVVADAQVAKKEDLPEQPKGSLAQLLDLNKVEVLTPENPEYDIIIPKIGANAQVIANVDPGNKEEYMEALKKGVAHASGTSFPGQGGSIYLFAHSTNYWFNVSTYNAVFYLLYKLEQNDEIDMFYQGQKYVYRVVDKKVVDPSETDYIYRQSNREFLTLQTCWPPGTTLKRLLVFAVRVAE